MAVKWFLGRTEPFIPESDHDTDTVQGSSTAMAYAPWPCSSVSCSPALVSEGV